MWRNTKTATEVRCAPSGVKPIVSIHRGIGYKIRLSCRTVSFPGCRTGRCGWLPARSGKRDAVTIVESYLTMVHFVILWKSLVPFLGQSQLLFRANPAVLKANRLAARIVINFICLCFLWLSKSQELNDNISVRCLGTDLASLKTSKVSIISWLSVLYALNGRKVIMWILFRYEKVII